jgi:hypothetical protein
MSFSAGVPSQQFGRGQSQSRSREGDTTMQSLSFHTFDHRDLDNEAMDGIAMKQEQNYHYQNHV